MLKRSIFLFQSKKSLSKKSLSKRNGSKKKSRGGPGKTFTANHHYRQGSISDESESESDYVDEWEKMKAEEKITDDTEWDVCNLKKTYSEEMVAGICRMYGFDIEDSDETRIEQQPLKSGKGEVDVDGIYTIHIYGYYCKRRAEGGYGIIVRGYYKPIVACYGYSKGKSRLYYLLKGIQRSLEIATQLGLVKVYWAINSETARAYFNLFNYPRMLDNSCHHGVACKRCLRTQLSLSKESFKQLFPVINAIIEMEYKTKFSVKCLDCSQLRNAAARYLAKFGAKELKVKPGASLNEVEDVEMLPSEFPEELNDIVRKDEEVLIYV